jgi:hypothetical protein
LIPIAAFAAKLLCTKQLRHKEQPFSMGDMRNAG